MKLARRHLALAAAFFATSLAAYFSPEPVGDQALQLTARSMRASDSVKQHTASAPRAAGVSSNLRSGGQMHLQEIRARTPLRSDFSSQPDTWSVAVTAQETTRVAKAETAPPPPLTNQAPPLPFKSVGRYEENGITMVFLLHQNRTLAARLGETIAEHYKVEGLQGGELTLRHLPTNQLQTLRPGNAAE